MTLKEAKKRILELRKIIDYHRTLYHVYDRSEISPEALDSLKHELTGLEEEYPKRKSRSLKEEASSFDKGFIQYWSEKNIAALHTKMGEEIDVKNQMHRLLILDELVRKQIEKLVNKINEIEEKK